MAENQRSRRRRMAERGAVATIVAVMLGGGVLLGMTALAVDVGGLMFERRQLQNGADAAAMTLAGICAKNSSNCNDAAVAAQLTTLAGDNASDESAQLDRRIYPNGQCGWVPGAPSLPLCTSTGNIAVLKECTPLPAWVLDDPLTAADESIPYVETYTLTDTGSGAARLLPFFAEGPGTEVSACARAVWGSPGSTGTTFPLTISACDWELSTANGTKFAPSPPYSDNPVAAPDPPVDPVPAEAAGFVVQILAHVTGNPTTGCGGSPYAPGGFGWLDDNEDSSDCRAKFNADGTAPGSTGASPPGGCKQDGMQQWVGQEVLVPVFDAVAGNGTGTTYTLSGVSSFFFAGWSEMETAKPGKAYSVYQMPLNLPGQTGDHMCEVPDSPKWKKATCVWGWFTSPILPVGTVSATAPSRGPDVVAMIG